MSDTGKETFDCRIHISFSADELVACGGLRNNPIEKLKKIISGKTDALEVVKENIAELEVKVCGLCENELVDMKEKLDKELTKRGYSSECLVMLIGEEMVGEIKSNMNWDRFMSFAMVGDLTSSKAGVGQSEKEEKPKQEEEVFTEADIDTLFAELEKRLAEQEQAKEAQASQDEDATPEEKREQKEASPVLEEIEALQSAEAFKRYARELANSAKYFAKYKKQDCVLNRCLLFVVEEGDGFSTYLELLSKHMSEIGIFPKNGYRPYNEVSNLPFDDDWVRIVGRACKRVNLVGIDLSQMIDKLEAKEFREFLRMIAESSKPCWVAFRIPAMDELSRKRVEEQLSVYFAVETINIPVMSLEQYALFGQQYAEKLGYEMSQDAVALLHQGIYEEKRDQKFYGFKTVMKVVEEMIYQKNLAESAKEGEGEVSLTITAEDVARVLKHYEKAENADSLEELIGIESIKERLDEIVAQILLNKSMGKNNTFSLHMRFLGNPGTGKTTVARLLGKLLKDKGVLSKGRFFEYKGRDLVGRYIGETTPKTAGICRDAYGSVLFIDEAYTLFKGSDNERDYGPEALAELITHMENHREDFMVIMAGYTDDMAKLMEGNRGLESRMPYEIMFENYTKEQLYEIFLAMSRKDYVCTEELKKVAKEYFESIPQEVIDQKDFANARFVRNLFERTVAKAALRLQMEPQELKDGKVVLVEGDFAKASNDREFRKMQEKKDAKSTTIGFC